MNTAQQKALLAGFSANLRVSGRMVEASNGERFRVLIEDATILENPYDVAQAKMPIYSTVRAMADDVEAPRSISTFTEDGSGRTHRVVKYQAGSDPAFSTWLVESQRL